MRAFVALALPDSARAALVAMQDRLPVGRPVAEDNLHLTLAFLDDQPVGVLETLHEALCDVIVPPLDLKAGALSMLGGSRPSLLCLEIGRTEALAALRDKVRGACRIAGIDLPRTRFRPHVTLVRLGRTTANADLTRLRMALETIPPTDLVFGVDEMRLCQSTLTPDGPIYETLASYPTRVAGAARPA